MRDKPVLMMGMHHSGTSLLATVMRLGGVWMVVDRTHHECSMFTIELHDRIGMNGKWYKDPIMTVDEVMARKDAFNTFLDQRLPPWFEKHGYDDERRWGFKDARPCVLLPLYRERFPKATVVHIVREPDAVADSLSRKNKEGFGRVCDKDFWKRLRKQYVERARSVGSTFLGGYHEINYEHLCLTPHVAVEQLFSGIEGVEMTPELSDLLNERVYQRRVFV